MKARLTHQNLYDNKKFKLDIPIGKNELNNQVKEILDWEVYKPTKKTKSNNICLDIGANIGLASLYLSQYFKTVYALEPSPEIYQSLVKNVKSYGNIKTFNKAISYSRRRDYFFSKNDDIPQTFFFNLDRMQEMKKRVEVRCLTIEDFMIDNKIDYIDLLKIDVEGSEYHIFSDKPFENVVDKIDMIVGEGHPQSMGICPVEVIPFMLKDYGFKTEFLKTPSNNFLQTISFKNHETGYKKDYRVPMYTNFIAYK